MCKFALTFLFVLLAVLLMNSDVSSSKIPESMLIRMKGVKSTKEFIKKFIMKKRPTTGEVHRGKVLLKQGKLDERQADFVAGMAAEPGGCIPKVQDVEIPPDSDPQMIYWPMCTPVEQCGGCCSSKMLHCVATSTQNMIVQVIKARYPHPNSDEFEFVGMKDVTLKRHTACECQCRTRPHHCNPQKHVYEAHSCRCRCKNEHLANTCAANKRWDNGQCACVCAKVTVCPRGEVFDKNACSCHNPGVLESARTTPASVCAHKKCRYRYRAELYRGRCKCRRIYSLSF